jgi:hypothetical protein
MYPSLISPSFKFSALPKTLLALGVGIALTVALAPSAFAQSHIKRTPKKVNVEEQQLGDILTIGAVDSDASQRVEARAVKALPALDTDAPELEFVKAPTR